MADKVLILLQENSGHVPLPDGVPAAMQQTIYGVIDTLAETLEDAKTTFQGAGKYTQIVQLTDNACTRANLLDALIDQTQKGRTIDLLILGHGSSERLVLHNESLTGGPNSNIRKLLDDAKARGCTKFNLRMVYMCNCVGSSVNDDWLAIGAKVSIGSQLNNWIPEPMITFFMHNWLSGKTACVAAMQAYDATIPFWTPIYPPTPVVKYKTVSVEYPCGVTGMPPKIKMCKRDQQIPDGVDLVPNSKIKESKPVVSGSENLKF